MASLARDSTGVTADEAGNRLSGADNLQHLPDEHPLATVHPLVRRQVLLKVMLHDSSKDAEIRGVLNAATAEERAVYAAVAKLDRKFRNTELTKAEYKKSMLLLKKIITNILDNPTEDRFRQLRKSNKLVVEHLQAVPENIDILRVCGFDNDSDVYVCRHVDESLFWIARAISIDTTKNMASGDQVLELSVQFQGSGHAIDLVNGRNSTIGELQQAITDKLGVPADQQRLFFKGKRLHAELNALVTAVCRADASQTCVQLMLMQGASAQSIEKMRADHQAAEREARIRATRRTVSIAQRNRSHEAREAVSTEYRFHAIEVLENFSDSSKAREILERLAYDRGVRAVMAKHKWSVGVLAEMPPDGKVGVDPVCVLGLNQNKGQKILLRLRTDDLLGFRKFLSIKQVLYHELSHNVHSEHDSKFYQLMRQVERECHELDWSAAGGHAIGGSPVAIASDEDHTSQLGGSAGHRLSTHTSRLLASTSDTNARQERGHETVQEAPSEPPRTGWVMPAMNSFYCDGRGINQPQKMCRDDDSQLPVSKPPTSPNAMEEEASEHQPTELTLASSQTQSLPDLAEVSVQLYCIFNGEREQRVHAALQSLRQRMASPSEDVKKVLSLLHKIVTNIIRHPSDAKYRAVKKSNRLFATYIARHPACLEFLQAIGFQDQSEAYVLVRDDPALLWIAPLHEAAGHMVGASLSLANWTSEVAGPSAMAPTMTTARAHARSLTSSDQCVIDVRTSRDIDIDGAAVLLEDDSAKGHSASPGWCRRHFQRIVGFVVVLSVIITLLVSLPLKEYALSVSAWIADHRLIGMLLYTVICWIAIPLWLPSTLLEGIAGSLFGLTLGFIVGLLGKTGGSLAAFLMGRYMCKNVVGSYLQSKFPTFRAMSVVLTSDDNFKPLLLFQLSSVPNMLKCYGLAITNLPALRFAGSALIGNAPHAFVWAYLGSQAEDIASIVSGKGEVSRERMLLLGGGIVITVVAMTLLLVYTKRQLRELQRERNASGSDDDGSSLMDELRLSVRSDESMQSTPHHRTSIPMLGHQHPQ
ncbi:TPA: hypothetical protein N0F65_003267 [Lagenidium giganteum]|uniref:WLM domain-containing protein n=1 Tax=Lagenidium giganteum TaxID=4803 RepID=A0AAV2YGT0_9STRA|nr:TPA: hypothetical protein N0F65_003267 [Lagenidium giganteum]